MKLIPAIDLMDGACVRLRQGDYDRVTRYADDPVALARGYEAAGADALHVVDLDGARDGRGANAQAIAGICRAVTIPVQAGGGLRSGNDLRSLFDLGVHRAVVGTVAVEDPARVAGWMARFGAERICLALDVRGAGNPEPLLATHGWRRQTDRSLWSLLEADYPEARHVLCTDIARDGMLAGANADLYAEAARRFPSIHWQASGGVGGAEDVRRLAGTGAAGCILGRALLEGLLTVEEARQCLQSA